ncbi:MAG: SAM-dependent methyltransferase, partial [Phormidium sp.]
LSDRQRYRLIELLDPESFTHYEFFLARPPFAKSDWSSDGTLLAAIPERNPCMDGWPSKCLFNYDYQIVNLTESEFQFLQACDHNTDKQQTLSEILTGIDLSLEKVRSLLQQQLIILTP